MNSTHAEINLSTLRKLIFLEIEELEKYIVKVVSFANQHHVFENIELEDLLSAVSQTEQNNPSGLKFSFTSIHSGAHILYHSTFLSIYSFFEYSLKITSQFVAFQDQVSVRKVNNMEKMYQYFDFLIEQVKLDRSLLEEEWRYLNIYKDIRNSIVHHNSTLGKNSSTVTEEYLKNYPSVELKDSGLFYFKNEQILLDLVKTGRCFFVKLLDAIEETKK